MSEQERRNELMIRLIERYLFHSNYKTDNPVVEEMAGKMVELDLLLMWIVTQ